MNEELTLFKVKQKIFWADYYNEEHKFQKFNFRKHGVTINNEFLRILAHNEYLTTQHLAFYQNMFKYYYEQSSVLSLDCHIFADFIPHLTQGITSNMIVSPIVEKTQEVQRNQFLFDSGLEDSDERETQQPTIMDNFYSKLIKTITYLNPKKLWTMFTNKNAENEIKSESFNDQQNNQSISNSDQETLKKFGFQIKNISYVQRDPNERDKIINKGEIKINNIIIQQNEKGVYKYQQLKIKLNNISSEQQLQKDKNIFSQFKNTFIPINLKNNHWIAAIIFYDKKQIQYLDSYYPQQQDVVEGLVNMVNYHGEKQKWDLIDQSPKQENSYDCGVFCLKALYQLYKTGKPIQKNEYTQNDISSFRQQLLYLAIIECQHNINQKLLNIILDYKQKN